jgi:hypothetical protein
MPIPTSALGMALSPTKTKVERGRVRFFAEAIGETDPRFVDLEAAHDAGYPDLPVLPTFLFGLKLDGPEPFTWLTDLGVDLRFILHGTQRFEYHQMAFAGDELLLEPRISELYEKRGGALEFLFLDTTVTRGPEQIAMMTETIIVRHPELEATR